MTSSLYLYEELLLLGLHNEKGTSLSTFVPQAIVVGALLELTFTGNIIIEDSAAKFVDVIDSTPHVDPLLDAVLHRIDDAPERMRLSHWMMNLSGPKDLLALAAQQLVADGVLLMDTSKALMVLKRTTFPVLNPEPEQEIVERLRCALFEDETVDQRTALLIGIAYPARLLHLEFGTQAVHEQKEWIETILDSSDVSIAARDALGALSLSLRIAF